MDGMASSASASLLSALTFLLSSTSTAPRWPLPTSAGREGGRNACAAVFSSSQEAVQPAAIGAARGGALEADVAGGGGAHRRLRRGGGGGARRLQHGLPGKQLQGRRRLAARGGEGAPVVRRRAVAARVPAGARPAPPPPPPPHRLPPRLLRRPRYTSLSSLLLLQLLELCVFFFLAQIIEALTLSLRYLVLVWLKVLKGNIFFLFFTCFTLHLHATLMLATPACCLLCSSLSYLFTLLNFFLLLRFVIKLVQYEYY